MGRGGPEFAFGLGSPGTKGLAGGEQLDPFSLCAMGRWVLNSGGRGGKAEELAAEQRRVTILYSTQLSAERLGGTDTRSHTYRQDTPSRNSAMIRFLLIN